MDTTSLRAVLDVSSVPNEPSVGVAIVQSPVSLGHAELAGLPEALNAARPSDDVPPMTDWAEPAVICPTTGPVRNWRSFTSAGYPDRGWPVFGSQPAMKSWPP